MAALLYPKAKASLLKGDIDMDGAVKVALVDGADYTYSAAHEFLSDVPSGGRVGISSSLTGKSFTDGHFASDPALFTSVTGDTFEILIGFIDTGVAGTSRLIWYQDSGVTGLPATPDGGNFTVDPDNTDGIWWDL